MCGLGLSDISTQRRTRAAGWLPLVSCVAVIAMLWSWPLAARACGGTFCDAGPQSMPVDQTAETILFVVDGDYVEAHVQVQFDAGDAERFSWIVPVAAPPEIRWGSWELVDALLDATVVTHGYTQQTECDIPPPAPPGGGNPPSGFLTMSDGGAGHPGDPTIESRGSLGSLDYVVLSGGSVDGVVTWLQDNDYAVDEQAIPILGEYLAEGSSFVAFKLDPSADAEEIYPVVIRYASMEPCVPLRLTRIAAIDDMPIRVFVLGGGRALPADYRHVELNRTRLDWPGFGGNYEELVSMAVDEAGGRAFVTEFAGATSIVDPEAIPTTYDELAAQLETADMLEALEILRSAGLFYCSFSQCSYGHDLVPGLLSTWIPIPEGVSAVEVYACPACYLGAGAQAGWDPAAFADDFRTRVVEPLERALQLLDENPYLTRMYTRISPHEMLADPRFVVRPEFPDVVARRGAVQYDECCGSHVRLPGGREVSLQNGWPDWDSDMPWAERVYDVPEKGALFEVSNASAQIDQIVADYNEGLGCDAAGATSTGGGDGPGSGATSGTGGSFTSGADGGAQGDGDGEDTATGCGCRSTPGRPFAMPWLLLFGLGLRGRRR